MSETQQKRIRKPFGHYPRPTVIEGPDLAVQSERDACDINLIMARYQKTGIIDHLNKYQGSYGVHTQMDYQSAMETLDNVEQMFADLPSTTREKFENDPGKFLMAVNDAKPEELESILTPTPSTQEAVRPSGEASGAPLSSPSDATPVVDTDPAASGEGE